MTTLAIAHAERSINLEYDCADIFRKAHISARKRMMPSLVPRPGDYLDREAGGYVPQSYRAAFAVELRWAWRDAKIIAEDRAYEASLPAIPDGVAEHIASIRAAAWFEPINGAGNVRYRELHSEAAAIEAAAQACATYGKPFMLAPRDATLPELFNDESRSVLVVNRKGELVLIAEPFSRDDQIGYAFTYPADLDTDPPEGEQLPLAA